MTHQTTETNEPLTSLTPIRQSERLQVLDLLRGVAVLGILLLNIETFSMPAMVRDNPLIMQNYSQLDLYLWAFTRIFVEYKFVGMFSLLFGFGIAMQLKRIEDKGGDARAIHYRRMRWLLLFGALHSVLLWNGEILFMYALLGMVFYWVLLMKPKNQWRLLIFSLFMVVLLSLVLAVGLRIADIMMTEQGMSMEAEIYEMVEEQDKLNLAPYPEQLAGRFGGLLFGFLMAFGSNFGWKVFAMMLLGAIAYRSKWLELDRSSRYYAKLAILMLIPGVLMGIYWVWYGKQHLWDLLGTSGVISAIGHISSVFMIGAYCAFVLWIYKCEAVKWLQIKLMAVGRMALTNYLAQTLIATTIFNGFGFALFNSMNRVEILLVAFAIWLVQISWSDWWLKRYYYGPFEWLWRSLSYGKKQPLRIRHH